MHTCLVLTYVFITSSYSVAFFHLRHNDSTRQTYIKDDQHAFQVFFIIKQIIYSNMSGTPITKADASNIQSMYAHNGQDTGKGSTPAHAQSFGDRNFEAAKEATARGFTTQSSDDQDTTKPGTTLKKKNP